jgi:hypothetical protein
MSDAGESLYHRVHIIECVNMRYPIAQFRLRSLLLLTLVVGVWLGHEAHRERTVRRDVEAISALGGTVELEASSWSLLRFIGGSYGQDITRVQISERSLKAVLPKCESLRSLREVEVMFDGTSDASSVWLELHRTFSRFLELRAACPAASLSEPAKVKQRCRRFLDKVSDVPGIGRAVIDDLKYGGLFEPRRESFHVYQPLHLSDGSLAELLVMSTQYFTAAKGWTFVLLVNDRCVDARHCLSWTAAVYVQDVDGDGCRDLAVENRPASPRVRDRRVQTLPGDSRQWLALYAIEPRGFRSLLPKDNFNRVPGTQEGTTVGEIEGGSPYPSPAP